MEFKDLLFEVRGPVARIAINRPGKLNSLRMTHTEADDLWK